MVKKLSSLNDSERDGVGSLVSGRANQDGKVDVQRPDNVKY